MERAELLGIGVSAINLPMAVREIEAWIEWREHRYVCVTGVHGIMESQRDETLRAIHNAAGLVTPDGMPLVWFLKSAGYKFADRVYGPDLMLAVLESSIERGFRHFLYGSSNVTLERLCSRLRVRCPGLRIVGTIAPPFRPLTEQEERETVAAINASGADIVWVGLSTPKQERWMARLRDRLNAPVLIGVGAAFDFHAGMIRQAPRIVQRSGFEWLYRLCAEPRRLWKRYLTNNPAFLWALLRQQWRQRHGIVESYRE